MLKEFTNNDSNLQIHGKAGDKFILKRAYLIDEENFVGSGINFTIRNRMMGRVETWKHETPFDLFVDPYQSQSSIVHINNVSAPIVEGLEMIVNRQSGGNFRLMVEYDVK